ncbi:MAG: cardiolipin synthase [Ruminococcaceae bacterium]|nr:cardiolipin synthase [Oscillospiraceae bacterium]
MSSKQKYRYFFRSLLIRRLLIVLLLLAQMAFIVFSILYYSNMKWVSLGLRILALLTVFHLITHPIPSAMKISTVLLILLFPLFGGALYWFFRFQTTTVGYKKALRRVERATAPAFRAIETVSWETDGIPADAQRLIRYLNTIPNFPLYQKTETAYYSDGKLFQNALLEELKQAKRYIFLEFFIIGEGEFWTSVLEVLKERAQAGVDVRVIYDDLGCFVTLPPKYMNRLRAYGIRCEVFNRFVPFLTAIQNNRDHRKIAVVDGTVAFTGGINLADEYINVRRRFGHWKDSAIRLRGDGAWSLTVMFLQMWSFLSNKQEDWERYYPLTLPTQHRENALVQPYCDSPMDGEHVSEQVYLQIIHGARHRLYITTPYLAPDDCLLTALKSAGKSGVDVRLILPHHPDKPAVHFTGRSYYRELIASGVRIYEYTNGFIHSKSILSDGKIACIGTANLDFRSLYLHFECGVCLYRADAVLAMETDFLQTLFRSKEITERDCRVSPPKKLLQDICRLFSPWM